jgi:3' terminal RNA ribose 2'-O-methyltransferase Hen1
MLLSITTEHQPATDLGYLLVKHPERVQEFELSFGTARVFYPQADAERCTAVLMVDIDPVGLVRGRSAGSDGPLEQYVNDRPYVASSFLAVAMKRVFASAMAGTSKGRQELADVPIPLIAEIPVLRVRGGAEMVRHCFEPLGYVVDITELPLDAQFPEWGASPYVQLRLTGTVRMRDLLRHLYVLLPAIDGDKHYFGEGEVDNLIAKAEEWLSSHPQREWITRRYLKRRSSLVRAALARLLEDDEEEIETVEVAREAQEETIERPISLNEQRMAAVLAALRQSGGRRVIDLGCGEGRLLGLLIKEKQFDQILGIDVSLRALDIAAERLHLERMAPMQRERLQLVQGALTYRDKRLQGYDVACAVEVIEHMDLPRLPAFERAVFEFARPGTVIVTTPNAEYNVRFETMPAGRMRHPDHRFEWTRAEFHAWADAVAARRGYAVRYLPIGEEDPVLGAPTQMALFTLAANAGIAA